MWLWGLGVSGSKFHHGPTNPFPHTEEGAWKLHAWLEIESTPFFPSYHPNKLLLLKERISPLKANDSTNNETLTFFRENTENNLDNRQKKGM